MPVKYEIFTVSGDKDKLIRKGIVQDQGPSRSPEGHKPVAVLRQGSGFEVSIFSDPRSEPPVTEILLTDASGGREDRKPIERIYISGTAENSRVLSTPEGNIRIATQFLLP